MTSSQAIAKLAREVSSLEKQASPPAFAKADNVMAAIDDLQTELRSMDLLSVGVKRNLDRAASEVKKARKAIRVLYGEVR